MYQHILVAVENSESDRVVLTHVEGLARLTGARLLVVHVADGWAARHFDELKLRESEAMLDDKAYPAGGGEGVGGGGRRTGTGLGMGDPASELAKVAKEEDVDLIAMATHGHRFLNDLVRGSTADRLRHLVTIPVLMVRAKTK